MKHVGTTVNFIRISDSMLTPINRAHFSHRFRHALLAVLLTTGTAFAEDQRKLASLPAPAQETLRQEMLDNLIVINEVLTLVAANKIKEAGAVAEQKLGYSAQGKHRDKPFDARPGPHMPPAMHGLAMDVHRAASEFATGAQTGDRERAVALLPNITTACVACHLSFRAR